MIKKLLWILWTPLLLVGLVLLIVLGVFVSASYTVEYESETYNKTTLNYTSDDLTIEVNSSYKLVLGTGVSDLIGKKFNYYVNEINGYYLILEDDESVAHIKLAINSDLKYNNVTCDYKFESNNNRDIIITGRTADYLLRGCYAFIEEFGGYKCYTSNYYVKTKDKITFPYKTGGYSKGYTAAFEMLDTDWISPKDNEYSWFRGFNTDEYRFSAESIVIGQTDTDTYNYSAVGKDLGGCVKYISLFCHTFAGEFCNRNIYFESNPECFALDANGNRRNDELCLSCEKTYEIILQEVTSYVNDPNRYDPNGGLQIISLTQTDDLTGCKCDECLKYAKEEGSYAGPNIRFVNRIAANFTQYKNLAFDTFAYRYTRTAPKTEVPLENVIVRLCTIECCASHYIDDEHCLANKAFMDDLAAWSKICNRIYIWDYCANFSYFSSVFPNLNILAHNIRVYKEHNVLGIYEEGNYTLNKNGADTEFAELRAYIISKAMQDPYCDWEQEALDFCKAYYGEAGENIYNFIMKASKWAGRRHLNIYKDPKLILPCTSKEFEELEGYFNSSIAYYTNKMNASDYAAKSAEEKASDQMYLNNIKNSQISWRYFKMMNSLFEFRDKDNFDQLKTELYADMVASGNSREHEVDASYASAGILQTAIIDLRPLFDLIVGNFVYGP